VDQTRNKELGPNDILFGDATNNIATAKWFWIVSNHFTLDSTISHDSTVLKNINHSNQLLFDTTPRQLTFKQDAAYLGPRHKIEAGYSARRLDQDGNRARVEFSTGQLVTTDQFSKLSWQPGAYIQDTVTGLKSRLTVTWGGRFDRLSLTGENVWMPRGSLAYSVSPKTRLTMAFGQYSEFPNFFQLAGQFANPALNAERATHYTMQMERSINDKTRVRVEVYDREDRNGIFSADTEYRLVGDHATGPGIPEPIQWNNSLRGHARGAEVFIERHSVNKLSGWVSYSYGAARYRDAATNLSFDGDFDQRHTLNSYATYRLKPTLNLSAKYRYGSNYPAAGFLTITGGPLRLNSERNRSHIPPYSCLDARANKAFNFDRWKLTLYGEVLNVLGRQNFRYVITTDTVNHFVSFDREDLFPRLPIAGIRLEF
jgi:outer membrane receptor for ferrienterochelin and colicin